MGTTRTQGRVKDSSNTNIQQVPLLEVKDLSISFKQYHEGLRETTLKVIKGLDLTIEQGEIVAVVGASGSGKSLLANAILGILPEHATLTGSISYNGEPLDSQRQSSARGKEIALIPQSVNSLDPLMKTGKQVRRAVKTKMKKRIQRDAFKKVGLATDVENKYPFQLSGGMARRVLVATAMGSGAKLVIADEPTPGLDVRALKETVRHIRQLADEGKGIMLITHDIETALAVADKVAVFYAGTTVEIAKSEDFTGKGEALRHPYTKALWNALPQNGFTPLRGSQPLPDEGIKGCLFEPRCSLATTACSKTHPDSVPLRGGMVRCFHA